MRDYKMYFDGLLTCPTLPQEYPTWNKHHQYAQRTLTLPFPPNFAADLTKTRIPLGTPTNKEQRTKDRCSLMRRPHDCKLFLHCGTSHAITPVITHLPYYHRRLAKSELVTHTNHDAHARWRPTTMTPQTGAPSSIMSPRFTAV